jgi:chromosome segregation ATPase
MSGRLICDQCKGNGFVRVPYALSLDEQWANCTKCNNQGEIMADDTKQIDAERKHFRQSAILWDQGFWKLSEEMEKLLKQKVYLQQQCRKAGKQIKEMKTTIENLENTIEQISRGPQDYEIRADDYTEKK